IASVPPPGGNGTTTRTKRAGQVCASALPSKRTSEAKKAAVKRVMSSPDQQDSEFVATVALGSVLDHDSVFDHEGPHHAAGGVLEDVAVEHPLAGVRGDEGDLGGAA